MDNYYQRNMDKLENCESSGLSYNQVLDIADVEGSGETLTEPVTLQEVKSFCKIDIDEDDDLIEVMMIAARMECEEISNIGFINRQVVLVQNNGNGGAFLPLGPNGDIESVKDIDGVDLTYKASGTKFKQILWPSHERLYIIYQTGYETLPAILRRALLECIYYHYDERKQRENAYPPIYIETLKPYKRVW